MAARVAIIDDDAEFLQLLRALLNREGYEAQLFQNGTPNSYNAVHDFAPDIIVLDIAMEDPGTGWRMLNLLKLDPLLGPKPVVCSHNLQQLQERIWYLKSKGCEVLPKPFYLTDLLTVLQQVELDQVHD